MLRPAVSGTFKERMAPIYMMPVYNYVSEPEFPEPDDIEDDFEPADTDEENHSDDDD